MAASNNGPNLPTLANLMMQAQNNGGFGGLQYNVDSDSEDEMPDDVSPVVISINAPFTVRGDRNTVGIDASYISSTVSASVINSIRRMTMCESGIPMINEDGRHRDIIVRVEAETIVEGNENYVGMETMQTKISELKSQLEHHVAALKTLNATRADKGLGPIYVAPTVNLPFPNPNDGNQKGPGYSAAAVDHGAAADSKQGSVINLSAPNGSHHDEGSFNSSHLPSGPMKVTTKVSTGTHADREFFRNSANSSVLPNGQHARRPATVAPAMPPQRQMNMGGPAVIGSASGSAQPHQYMPTVSSNMFTPGGGNTQISGQNPTFPFAGPGQRPVPNNSVQGAFDTNRFYQDLSSNRANQGVGSGIGGPMPGSSNIGPQVSVAQPAPRLMSGNGRSMFNGSISGSTSLNPQRGFGQASQGATPDFDRIPASRNGSMDGRSNVDPRVHPIHTRQGRMPALGGSSTSGTTASGSVNQQGVSNAGGYYAHVRVQGHAEASTSAQSANGIQFASSTPQSNIPRMNSASRSGTPSIQCHPTCTGAPVSNDPTLSGNGSDLNPSLSSNDKSSESDEVGEEVQGIKREREGEDSSNNDSKRARLA